MFMRDAPPKLAHQVIHKQSDVPTAQPMTLLLSPLVDRLDQTRRRFRQGTLPGGCGLGGRLADGAVGGRSLEDDPVDELEQALELSWVTAQTTDGFTQPSLRRGCGFVSEQRSVMDEPDTRRARQQDLDCA